MVTMKNEFGCPKAPLKGELLRRVTQRYPEMDTGAIEIVSHIQSIARALTARLNNDLADYGLGEGKFYVLVALFSEELMGHDDPSPSDIADSIGVTRGTITGLLDGLERDEYLERRQDNQDRRALTIRLTEKGRQFMDNFMVSGACSMGKKIPLNAEERRTLMELLSKVLNALGAPDDPCGCL